MLAGNFVCLYQNAALTPILPSTPTAPESVPDSGARTYPALIFYPSFFVVHNQDLKQTIQVQVTDIVETETEHFADAKHSQRDIIGTL